MFPAAAKTTRPVATATASTTNTNDRTENADKGTPLDWLENTSYQQQPPLETPSLLHKRSHDDHVTDDDAASDSDRHASKRHKKHKKHKKSKQQDGPSSKKPKSLEPSKPDTIWISEATPKDGYRLDKKPDFSNLSYDTLYSRDQAIYRRYYGNHCVGLGKDQSIKFTDNRNRKRKKNHSKQRQERYHISESLEPDQDAILQLVSPADGGITDKLINESMDIVPLEVGRGCSPGRGPLSGESYLVQRTSEYNQQLLHEPHNVQLWAEFIAFQDEALVWGKLPMLAEGERVDTKRRRMALLERKVAIYEKALASNPFSEELIAGHMELVQNFWETEKLVTQWKNIVFKQPNSSLLWLKYIEFCQSRFSFFRTSAVIGLYHKCITTLSSILNRTLVSHKPEPHAQTRLMAIVILYCYFLRQCGHLERGVAIFQALIEFNVCQPKSLEEESFNIKREKFKTFWMSQEPRIGESNSRGWAAFSSRRSTRLGVVDVEKYGALFQEEEGGEEGKGGEEGGGEGEGGEEEEMTEEERKEMRIVDGLPIHEAWIALETYREQHHSLPNRDSENADSSISFTAISPCLFSISDAQLHWQLIHEFLRFLGASVLTPPLLPTVFPRVNEVVSSSYDVIGCIPPAHAPFSMWSLPSFNYQPSPLGADYTSCYQQKLHSLINCTSSDEAIAESLCTSLPPTPPSLKPFVFNLFNQSLSLVQSHDVRQTLAYSWLAHEISAILELHHCHHQSEGGVAVREAQLVQSLATELLSQAEEQHDYIFLWDIVMSLERVLELKKSKPCQLSRMLLEPLGDPAKVTHKDGLYSVCQCVVECALGLRAPINCYARYKQSRDLALYALVAVSDGTFSPTLLPVTPPQISQTKLLKSSSHYQHLTDSAIRDHTSFASVARLQTTFSQLSCCAYFEYLLKGLEPACTLLSGFISQVGERTQIHQKLHLLQIMLIDHHGKCQPIKPCLLREACLSALESFPLERVFLQKYIESERESFISGRMRRYFNSLEPDSDSFVPWVYAVGAELDRHQRVGVASAQGEVVEELSSVSLHRVQSLFRRATGAACGWMGVALWRLYIKFEMEYGSKSAAKAIFYQAIQQCPWAKVLYVDGVHYFPEEAEKIVDEIMEEKEIRTHTPLEEINLLQMDSD